MHCPSQYGLFNNDEIIYIQSKCVCLPNCINFRKIHSLIYFRMFYGRYNDLVQHYNTPLYQILCDLVLCWCVLHTPDLTPLDMTSYTLDSTAGSWSQHVNFTLPEHLFTHLGFPECPCCLECNIYSRIYHDYGLMIFD